MVKRYYCSEMEIMVMDLHVEKMTKITLFFKKKNILYRKKKWDEKNTKHISSFVLLITISQCTAQSLSKSKPLFSKAASFPAHLLPFVSI